MKAKRCRSPKKRSHKAKSSLLAGMTREVVQQDNGLECKQSTCFQNLAPFKHILDPPKKARGGKKSVQERPGRHSMNLAPMGANRPTSPSSRAFKFSRSLGDKAQITSEVRRKAMMGSQTTRLWSPSQTQTTSPTSAISPISRLPYLNEPFRMFPPDYIKSPQRLRHDEDEEKENKLREKELSIRKRLVDFTHIADACRRQGRIKGESQAYYCMGVLHDNLKDYSRAVLAYEKYANIAERIGDTLGEALAHNCLGISYSKMAASSKTDEECYRRAIHHHRCHRDMGDALGRFIAHTNLGLVFNATGSIENTVQNHESALKHAIRIGDGHLQSIAVGHLGLSACSNREFSTARACMERYLELVTQLGNKKAKEEALLNLGYIAKEQGENKTAATYYRRALEMALSSKNTKNASKARVHIGIITGNLLMNDHMERLSGELRQTFRLMSTS
ncbi:hypothetical protein AAMO2058_000629200 [Amorphochlora amoebiformis]